MTERYTMDIEDKIIDCLKEIIYASGLSIYDIAQLADINQATLTNLKKRGNLPTLPTLIKICQGLNIKLSEFFIYVENKDSDIKNL